jgi:hypothetical protein
MKLYFLMDSTKTIRIYEDREDALVDMELMEDDDLCPVLYLVKTIPKGGTPK